MTTRRCDVCRGELGEREPVARVSLPCSMYRAVGGRTAAVIASIDTVGFMALMGRFGFGDPDCVLDICSECVRGLVSLREQVAASEALR